MNITLYSSKFIEPSESTVYKFFHISRHRLNFFFWY